MLRVWRAYRVRVVHAAMPRADVVRVLCACLLYTSDAADDIALV